MAHQTIHRSATIGILSTTTIQMKPHVMAQGYPGIFDLERLRKAR
jgi:hypothetical protein